MNMFPFAPPTISTQLTSSQRPPSSQSTCSSLDTCSAVPNPDRLLPSLLSAPLGQTSHVGTVQLNSLLYQTANLMAMNAQLRKEIEHSDDDSSRLSESLHSVRRVRAASHKTGEVPSIPLPPFFLSPDVAGTLPLVPFQQTNARPPIGRKSPLPDSYKTVMCQAWLESQACSFGENCRFAHGEHELRPLTQPQRANRKYKTKLCEKYTNTGLCPYGSRCLFIHPDIGHNAYIRPDKLEELKKKQEERKKKEEETSSAPSIAPVDSTAPMNTVKTTVSSTVSIGATPIRPRQTLRPHPSWPLEPSHFFDKDHIEEEGSVLPLLTNLPPPSLTHRPHTPLSFETTDAASPPSESVLASDSSTPFPCSSLSLEALVSSGSSGYQSDGLSVGGSTPASGLTSGTSSPLDALLAGTRVEDSSLCLLPPMSDTVWPSDPFCAAIHFDNIAREMANEFSL